MKMYNFKIKGVLKTIITFCFLVSMFSCSKHYTFKEMAGRYESSTPKLSFKSYAIGEVLILKVDSTYYYKGCGQIIKGKWDFNSLNDSIFLFCHDFRYRDDSLNEARKPTCDPTLPYDKFKILHGPSLIYRNNKLNVMLSKVKL